MSRSGPGLGRCLAGACPLMWRVGRGSGDQAAATRVPAGASMSNRGPTPRQSAPRVVRSFGRRSGTPRLERLCAPGVLHDEGGYPDSNLTGPAGPPQLFGPWAASRDLAVKGSCKWV